MATARRNKRALLKPLALLGLLAAVVAVLAHGPSPAESAFPGVNGKIAFTSDRVGKMYWTDSGTDKIQRANVDGSGVEDLVSTGLNNPIGIALDVPGGKMYWVNISGSPRKIQRGNLDGSGVEDLVTAGLISPVDIALDVAAGKMYWSDAGTAKIQRANLDGSSVEGLITSGLGIPRGIALDVAEGKMYWTDAGTNKLQRANLDGSGVEDLVTTGLLSPVFIALDISGGKMYWGDSDTDKIQRANLDGSSVEDLITSGLSIPNGIALDVGASKIYWTDAGTNKLQRANLDGSGVEDLVTTGLIDPQGMALDVAPPDSDADDACPSEDSMGFDADSDGCIDTIPGLSIFIDTLFAEGVIDSTMQNSLHAKMDAALASLDRDKVCTAINQLNALKNQIEAQTGEKVSEDASSVVLQYITNVQTFFVIASGVGSC